METNRAATASLEYNITVCPQLLVDKIAPSKDSKAELGNLLQGLETALEDRSYARKIQKELEDIDGISSSFGECLRKSDLGTGGEAKAKLEY